MDNAISRLQQARARLGLSPRAVSLELGRNSTWLWKIEAGLSRPTPESAEQLCSWLAREGALTRTEARSLERDLTKLRLDRTVSMTRPYKRKGPVSSECVGAVL